MINVLDETGLLGCLLLVRFWGEKAYREARRGWSLNLGGLGLRDWHGGRLIGIWLRLFVAVCAVV